MAYREPESSIYLLKGCPCDLEYNNTIYFENKTTQWAYFRTLSILSLSKQYYQRYERGYLRIQARADDLYGVNYMVFSNDPRFATLNPNLNDIRVFYCFVDNVEYINENVTEIHYTIDVMQTYMFDYKLGQCFVEREHTITDRLYENLIEEDFQPTNYTETVLRNIHFEHWCVCIEYAPNRSAGATDNCIAGWQVDSAGGIIYTNGTYNDCYRNRTVNGVMYLYLPIKEAYLSNIFGWTNTAINRLISLSATITNLTYVPYELCGQIWADVPWDNIVMTDHHNCIYYNDENTATYISSMININHPTDFYGSRASETPYNPINAKLNTFPYQYLKITNNQGQSLDLMYENFYEGAQFKIIGCMCPTPEISLYPCKYNTQEEAVEHRISMENYPTSVWSEDSALRYRTENKNRINMGILGGVVSIAAGLGLSVITENPLPAISGVSSGVAQLTAASTANTDVSQTMNTVLGGRARTNYAPFTGGSKLSANPNEAFIAGGSAAISHQIANLLDLEKKRDTVNGSQSYTNILYFLHSAGFKIIYKGIKPYEAKRIDNYFSMFGYAIRDTKIPNIASRTVNELRPHWNYIKNGYTCVIPFTENGVKHSVENDVEVTLQAIYNKGITFWMDGEEVGDYSLDNSPQI